MYLFSFPFTSPRGPPFKPPWGLLGGLVVVGEQFPVGSRLTLLLHSPA